MSDLKSGDSKSQSESADGPPSGFKGATVGSFMQSQAPPATGFGGEKGFGSTTAPGEPERPPHVTANEAGAPDPSIPVTTGNQHMIIGASSEATKKAASSSPDNIAQVGGPGTSSPNAGLTRTAGEPESGVEPITQVGNKVIIPETTAADTAPEFEPGKPEPRTDIDADPHEVTSPGFQGLDRINRLPVMNTGTGGKSIEHRGAPNEPRVVGVTSVGDPPVEVIGSKAAEEQGLTGAAGSGQAAKSQAAKSHDDTAFQSPAFKKHGELPANFPHRSFIEKADEATYAKMRKRIAAGTLQEIPNIDAQKAKEIEVAVAE